MRIVIQADEITGTTHTRRELARCGLDHVAKAAGSAWTCVRCGCMQWTVTEQFGRIILSCFRCPTHVVLIEEADNGE